MLSRLDVFKAAVAVSIAVLAVACNPTIKLEGGEKPMEFNINIKHEILIKVEKDVEDILSDDALF